MDKIDQMVAVYRSRIRQKKWWWPIFSYLLDVSVVNAWLLMKKNRPNDPNCANLLVFRRYVARFLLESYGTPSLRKARRSIVADSRYDGRNHIVEYTETDKRCAFCGKKQNLYVSNVIRGFTPKNVLKHIIHHLKCSGGKVRLNGRSPKSTSHENFNK